MTRWLLYRFLPYFTGLFLLLGTVLLLTSEAGLQLLWRQLESRLPPQLQIDSVNGRLLGRIGIAGLRFENEQWQLEVKHAWLRWQPLALLQGEIRIAQIVVVAPQVKQLAAAAADDRPPAPRPERLPQLPNIWLQELQLREFRYTPRQGAAQSVQDLRLRARLRQQQLTISSLDLHSDQWGHWQLQLKAELAAEQIRLAELSLQRQASTALKLQAAGDCAWPSLECRLQTGWHGLQWPLDEGRWRSEQGEISLHLVDGLVNAQLQAKLGGEGLPPSELEASAQADRGVQDFALNWTSEAGGITATGQFVVARAQLRSQLELKELNLAPWLADYPSDLEGSIALLADFGDGPVIQVEAARLRGELRGATISLDARGSYRADNIRVDELALDWGKGQLRGKAALLGQAWSAQLQAQAPRLALWHPSLAGSIDLDAQLSGSREAPRLNWNLRGERLQAVDLRIATLSSHGRVGLGPRDALQFDLQLEDAALPGAVIPTASIKAEGTLAAWQSEWRLQEARGAWRSRVSGSWEMAQRRLRLALEDSELNLAGLRWQQSESGPIRWQAGGDWRLPRHCWTQQNSRSCIAARSEAAQLSATLELQSLPLSLLERRLPLGSRLSGSLDAQAQILPSPLDALRSQLDLQTTAIRLSVDSGDDPVELLALQPGRLSARGEGPSLQAEIDIPAEQGAGIQGELRFDKSLQSRLAVDFRDIAFLSALAPEVLRAAGAIEGELQLSGTPAQPIIDGRLGVRQAELVLDTPGITLSDVDVSLQGSGKQDIALTARARSGEGQIEIRGKLGWQDSNMRAEAEIAGDRFLASNTQELMVLVSPKLKLDLDGKNIDLRGTLRVPEANLRPRSLESSGLVLPDADQQIRGEQSVGAGYRLRSEIELILGQQVRFEGFGLKTAIGGRIVSRVEPDRVPTAVGELKLRDGRYKAYGQDLTLEKGRLIFSGGAISQPGIDLQAYRRPRPDVLVGVKVRGTLEDPSFSLYSEPGMRETDQLSYLVLGRAAESQNEADEAAVNNAALALGLKGGDFLANRFKGKLGLDEVRIGAQPGEAADQAALVLGKYLTPDIYVSYGIGLFEPTTVFTLRYRLSSKWALQTESGVESSGDIIYTIER